MLRRDGALIRALGVWGLAASVVNITVGGGIFGLPARVGSVLGAAAPLAYLVCAAAMALIVLCIAEAGSRVALTGGPYAYIEVAFGPFVGFLGGVLLWVLGTTALGAVATLVVTSLAHLAPKAGFETAAGRMWLLLAALAVPAAVNVRGVREGARLNAAVTAAKLVPLVALIVIGAFAVRPAHLRWTTIPAAGDVARASVLLVFAFAGVESAVVPSGEVRDPARTVPRAVLLALLGVTLLYVGIQVVTQGILGPELSRFPDTPLAEAAGRALGPGGRTLLLAAATVSMFGHMSGMMLAVPRILFAFARDGVLPPALAAVHARYRTPHVAIVAQAAVTFALAASGTFERLAIVANVAVLLLYAGCAAAAWQLRRRNVRAGGVPFHVPLAGAVPAGAMALVLFILSSLPLVELAVIAAVIAGAGLLFLATRGGRDASAARDARSRDAALEDATAGTAP